MGTQIVMDDTHDDALLFDDVEEIVSHLNQTDYNFEFTVNGTDVTIAVNGSTFEADKKPYTFPPTISPTTSSPTIAPSSSPTISPTSSFPTSAPISSTPTVAPSTTLPSGIPTRFPSTSGTSSSSCAGFCSSQAPSGCYCDSICIIANDCCNDYQQLCVGNTTSMPAAPPTPSPSTTNSPITSSPSVPPTSFPVTSTAVPDSTTPTYTTPPLKTTPSLKATKNPLTTNSPSSPAIGVTAPPEETIGTDDINLGVAVGVPVALIFMYKSTRSTSKISGIDQSTNIRPISPRHKHALAKTSTAKRMDLDTPEMLPCILLDDKNNKVLELDYEKIEINDNDVTVHDIDDVSPDKRKTVIFDDVNSNGSDESNHRNTEIFEEVIYDEASQGDLRRKTVFLDQEEEDYERARRNIEEEAVYERAIKESGVNHNVINISLENDIKDARETHV